MGDRPGRDQEQHGPVVTAISTATRGNATAFGFSITITGSFGVLQKLVGSPTLLQIFMFGVAAAATVGIVEALVTRGFRERPGVVPAEVRMLGTAQDFVSVAAGLGAAAGVAALLESGGAWPLAAAVATFVFLAAESAETLLAELIQKRRGDPEAEQEQQD
jgi:MFS family permease